VPEWRAKATDGALARAGGWVSTDEVADLDALASSLADVHVRRSAAWLRWRLARPDARYALYRPTKGVGLLVLKRYGVDTLNIVELLAPTAEAFEGALALAFGHAAAEGRKTVTAWLPEDHPHAPRLREAGFTRHDSGRIILEGGPQLAGRWHEAALDSDVF
jgi:hypothetical protein